MHLARGSPSPATERTKLTFRIRRCHFELVTDDVYRHLLKRVVLSARARQAKGQPIARPTFGIGSTTICEPADGVVEAVVIVRGRARTRAVAIRLEGMDNRWRASAINVL